ncbi:hypothetical protein A8B80_12350 [Marinobacter sp. EhN04]|nr:hypothetical protein A8B80_12350 [Marinobacter sp. EhN04]
MGSYTIWFTGSAKTLDRYEKYILLVLSANPSQFRAINRTDAKTMETTDLVMHSAAMNLRRKGLIDSFEAPPDGVLAKLTKAGLERAKPLQESFFEKEDVVLTDD